LHPFSLWESAAEFAGGSFAPPEYAGNVDSGSATIDQTDDDTEKDNEIGETTGVGSAANTDETFTDSDTASDSTTEVDTLGGSYNNLAQSSGSFSEVIRRGESDTETDKDNGTVDGGVTTDNYDDEGSDDDSVSSSYVSDASVTVGGVTATGHDQETADSELTLGVTATGDYTTDPAGGDDDGYASSDQKLSIQAQVTESFTQQRTGGESGNGLSVSGSGSFADSATSSADSNSTTDDAADGTETQSGSLTKHKSELEQVQFAETASLTGPYMSQQITYSSSGSQTVDDDGGGAYGDDASGSETESFSNSRDTSESITTTMNDGGPPQSSTGSGTTHTGGASGPTTISGESVGQAPTVPLADSLSVNRKRTQRLMRLMGLEAIYPKRRMRTSQPGAGHKIYPYLLRDVEITRPDQVWSSDITYLPMRRGFFYLTAVIDWHSRYVLAWRLSNTLDGSVCCPASVGSGLLLDGR